MNLSTEAYTLIVEALDISKSFKVYGEGRVEHQDAIDRVLLELKDVYVNSLTQ